MDISVARSNTDGYEPIDWQIILEIDTQYIHGLARFLHHLEVSTVINSKKFSEHFGYKPYFSSIFVFGSGGSYDFPIVGQKTIHIYNGTLQAIDNDTEIFEKASNLYSKIKWGYKATNFLA
jgi:hypothetical protein